MSSLATNRRDLLKLGALAAVPVAALAPAAAIAAPDTAAEATQVRALMRDAVRRFNAGGVAACADLTSCGDALGLPAGTSALRLAGEAEPEVALAADGAAARWSQAAVAVRQQSFDGDTTLERMARFQGQSATQSEHAATLVADLARTAQGWAINRLHLA